MDAHTMRRRSAGGGRGPTGPGECRLAARWAAIPGWRQPHRRGPEAGGPKVMWLQQVLGLAVVGPRHQHLGHVHDLVVRLLADPPGRVVVGLVVDVGGHRTQVPAAAVRRWRATAVEVREVIAGRAEPGSSAEGAGERLRRSVLGQPVLTTPRERRARRITDVGLRPTGAGWTVCAVDTRARWQRLCGRSRRLTEWSDLVQRRSVVAPRPTAPSAHNRPAAYGVQRGPAADRVRCGTGTVLEVAPRPGAARPNPGPAPTPPAPVTTGC